jgi:hypothetical protein
MIEDILKTKSASEQATIKGIEIAKIKSATRIKRAKYDIEIVNLKVIEGGIEAFVRAWTGDNPVVVYGEENDEKVILRTIPANTQIGFGKYRSADIARLNLLTPPILVDDSNGDIIGFRTHAITGVRIERRLKEDLREALYQYIERTLNGRQQIFDSSKIVPNKIEHTSTTFRPVAGAVSPCDGFVQNTAGATWAGVRDASDGTAAGATSPTSAALIRDDGSDWTRFDRVYLLGDGSAGIGTDDIDSGTFTVDVNDLSDAYGAGVNLYASSPANDDDIVTQDFDQTGTTPFSTTVALASIGVGTEIFTLNPAGLAAISKVGLTKFSFKIDKDAENDEPTKANTLGYADIDMADTGGTATDPTWVIEHSVPISSNMLLMF